MVYGDIDTPEREARMQAIKEEVMAWKHPLDDSRVREYLHGILDKDLYQDLVSSPRPALTSSPDLKELVGAEQQTRRWTLGPHIGLPDWILMTLYEESFAIRPRGTVGGMLTHLYDPGSTERTEAKIVGVVGSDIFQLSLENGMRQLGEFKDQGRVSAADLEELLRGIAFNGRYVNSQDWTVDFLALKELSANPLLLDRFSGSLGTLRLGWEFFQITTLLKDELRTDLTDQRLKQEFELGDEGKLLALRKIWVAGSASTDSTYQPGSYRSVHEPGFVEGLRQVAILRASPDFNFLYRQFNTSGVINSKTS